MPGSTHGLESTLIAVERLGRNVAVAMDAIPDWWEAVPDRDVDIALIKYVQIRIAGALYIRPDALHEASRRVMREIQDPNGW